MNNESLLLRRQELITRSAQLRLELADQAQVIRRPLALTDRALTGLLWLTRHPQWPLGALLIVVILRPQRALRWGGRAWWAWTALNRTLNWTTRYLASAGR